METNDHTPPTADRPDDGVPTDRRPLGFWLRLTDRQLSAAFADEFEAEGLDRRDWMLLNLLAGDVDDDRLARFVASGPHRGGKRLRRMAERGWITRTDDGWALTDAGRAQRDVLKTRVDAIRDRVAGAISPEDYATVVASLEAIAREFGWDGGERMPRGPRGRFSHRPGRAEWHGRGPWAFDREGRGNAHHGFGPDFGPARDHHACGPHGAHGAHGDTTRTAHTGTAPRAPQGPRRARVRVRQRLRARLRRGLLRGTPRLGELTPPTDQDGALTHRGRRSASGDERSGCYRPAAPASEVPTSVRWKFWNDRDAVGPRCP